MIFNLILCISIIVLYILTHIGKGKKGTKDKVFLIIVFTLLFVLIATREMTVGNDTGGYLNFYEKCGIYKWRIFDIDSYYERGYATLNVVLNYLHISSRGFLCVMAFVCSFAVYKFIKDNSNNYLVSVLLFINMLFFYQSMTMMRQFLAFSIVISFGFSFVKSKKLVKFIAVVLLASLFHSSALISLFIYPLYHLKYTKRTTMLIIVGSITMAIFLSQIYPLIASFLDKEAYYTEIVGEACIGNLISTIMFLLIYVFSLIVIRPEKRQKYSFYIYGFLFTTAIYFISINMGVLNRASQYYAIFAIVALPNIVEANMKESKMLIESAIVGLFMIYSSVIMVNKPEWNSAYNYKSCIVQEEGYICE